MARTLQPWQTLLALLATPLLGGAALAAPAQVDEVDRPLERAFRAAGFNVSEIYRALDEAPSEARDDMRFLIVHMPDQDLRELKADFLLSNLQLAEQARAQFPWAANVPDEVWRNAVLPYAQVNEEREPWRRAFLEAFGPVVADAKSTTEATMLLNAHIFGALGVKYSTKRNRPDQAPSESIEIGMASCTGLSILLADACRAVGVPARLAGTANWFDSRGNHTWVEIWDQNGWHFVGAAEPDPAGLDRGWFAGDAARATPGSREFGIWAATWEHTGDSLPMVWAPQIDWVPAVDVTERYLPEPTVEEQAQDDGKVDLLFSVRDAAAESRVVAEVRLIDPTTRTVVFAGQTRDESKDANDFLIARVEPGSNWDLEVRHQNSLWLYSIRAGEEARQTLALEPNANPRATRLGRIRGALRAWFEADAEARGGVDLSEANAWLAEVGTTPQGEALARRLVWQSYRDAAIHADSRADFDANRVRFEQHEAPYTLKTVGERPAQGWPLVIAMHGGGGTTQEFNDSQWRHMQIYYKDQLDLPGGYKYLALRAPNNTWNGFYDNYVYPLIENLIHQQLLFGDVDPDKVYAIGYSHGGYGAFAIGPKIPDRFAAVHASAAAPTDGETSAVGLHTLRFTYMIGSEDKAYGRAERCQSFAERVAGLQAAHPGSYPTEMLWIEGNGHGGLPDRDFIRQLYPYSRMAAPQQLNWELTDPVVAHHYWVHAPQPGKQQHVSASVSGNVVEVQSEGRASLELWLTSKLVDPTRPLTVNWNGQSSTHSLSPSFEQLCRSMLERGDPGLLSSMRVRLGS